MPTLLKKNAPAAERNREPIAAILRKVLPGTGTVLETASGTGQHSAYFARLFPHLQWQPSDKDPHNLESIRAWRQEAALANLQEPLLLDVGERWNRGAVQAVLSINMIHIAPWEATLGLLSGAFSVLPEGGLLFFYGPVFDERPAAPSNVSFDQDLRWQNPHWGVRQLSALREAAENAGFFFQDRFDMPANNVSLVFRKKPQTLVVRLMTESDDAVVGTILVKAFRETYAEKMPEVVVTDRRVRELEDMDTKRTRGKTWVAEVGGNVVGTVYAIDPGKSPLSWREGYCEIKHLAVINEFRRSGISEELMKHALKDIRNSGAKGACLHTRRGAVGVARYYEAMGFRRDPRGDTDWLPEVFLEGYLLPVEDFRV